MITVGVDLAASAPNTAVAVLDGLRVRHVALAADDATVLRLAGDADKVGIDCPFGWPEEFVDFVLAHRHGYDDRRTEDVSTRKRLVYRATDRYCLARGLRPLSVSADRIAHAALRCAGILRALDVPDRSGAGRALETYPSGSLQLWGLTAKGYKGNLGALPADLVQQARLTFAREQDARVFRAVDHAFDAVVAALTASAALVGLVEEVPAEYRERARVEGWISLPTSTLPEVAAAVAGSGHG